MVEGGGLENRLALSGHGGSNPSLSAIATNSNLCTFHLIKQDSGFSCAPRSRA